MAEDLIKQYSTADVPTRNIGQVVYEMTQMAKSRRTNFERKWYDNNFFDDGYHYRFLSRVANRISDIADRATIYTPMRAIPKASRQIRGVANLLVAPDYTPIVYPEKVNTQDPQALQQAKDIAHKTGRWLLKEWEKQELIEKIAFMVILAAKHGVSWLQVWPDAVDEAIKTQVYDAFDVFVLGNMTEVSDLPFMIKAVPQLLSQIKANEYYDKDQVAKILPDNKFAASEIKQAYMSSRYNNINNTDSATSLILSEAYIKEYLNEDNTSKIRMQDDGEAILKGKKNGDPVIRQVCVAANVWLRDRYVNLPDYPFVDFRFEAGPIYQVPLIERFIPTNKSLDALVSRAERYSHTMVAGSWSQRAGEQYKITNDAGGQILEYASTAPIQNQIAPIPAFFFQLMEMLQSFIEEQGVSTSTLAKLPKGIKANAAIETLKESEYANLVITSRRLKNTVKTVAERMLDIADNKFVTPQTVYDMKDGNPEYFDVIGASALEGRKRLKIDTPEGLIPLKKDYKVEIQAESGMAYTREGRKAAAKELGDFMVQMAQLQMVSPDVVKIYIKKLLEVYQFGATDEIMEALESPDLTSKLSEEQLTSMKIAVLEALKESGEIGQEASQRRVDETKVGVLEALKDAGEVGDEASQKRVDETKVGVLEALQESGLADAMGGGQNMNAKTQAEIAKIEQDMKLKEEQHAMRMQAMQQDMMMKKESAQSDSGVKEVQAAHDMAMKEKETELGMEVKKTLAKAQAKAILTQPKEANAVSK